MDAYVDGFVLPVPTDELDAYREMATDAGRMWMDHGALAYFEGVGDDLEPEMDEMSIRTFPELAGAGNDETVVFAYIVYESREHRDEVNEKVMAEMDADAAPDEMPFDVERMAYGGFRSLVNYED